MAREPSTSTTELVASVAAWNEEYQAELRRQATKHNTSSERRMRKLLRDFRSIYEAYRDATLESRQEDAPLAF